jgi:uncharacterized lipoprotein YmbA
MRSLLILILTCGLLCACQSSPKKNYYLLTSPVATTKNASTNASNITTLIGIGPVVVADYLNRLHIIYQTDNNSVIVAENDYWAEPLDKGIARVIALNLTQRNSARSFVTFPWRSDSIPRYSLRLKIESLSRTASEASLDGAWEIFDNSNKISVTRHHFTRSTSAQSTPKALAQAYSKLLAELADEIDLQLNQLL